MKRRYRKLTNRSLGIEGISRVWVAEDHLLLVTSLLVYEGYARFYFSDIVGLAWEPSRRFRIYQWLFGGLALAAVLGSIVLATAAFLPLGETARNALIPLFIGSALLAGGIFLAALLLFLLNLVRGESCNCYLLTASGSRRLRAPTRIRQARKLEQALRTAFATPPEPAASAPPPIP